MCDSDESDDTDEIVTPGTENKQLPKVIFSAVYTCVCLSVCLPVYVYVCVCSGSDLHTSIQAI